MCTMRPGWAWLDGDGGDAIRHEVLKRATRIEDAEEASQTKRGAVMKATSRTLELEAEGRQFHTRSDRASEPVARGHGRAQSKPIPDGWAVYSCTSYLGGLNHTNRTATLFERFALLLYFQPPELTHISGRN
jgi:hypothetical protein